MSLARQSLPPELFIERLDGVNRKRSIEDHESLALETAIVSGRVRLREAARLGLKRNLRVYEK